MQPRCVPVGVKVERKMVAIVPRSGHVRVMIGFQSVVHVGKESKAFLASFATLSEDLIGEFAKLQSFEGTYGQYADVPT